jgi:hypothetical protein
LGIRHDRYAFAQGGRGGFARRRCIDERGDRRFGSAQTLRAFQAGASVRVDPFGVGAAQEPQGVQLSLFFEMIQVRSHDSDGPSAIASFRNASDMRLFTVPSGTLI